MRGFSTFHFPYNSPAPADRRVHFIGRPMVLAPALRYVAEIRSIKGAIMSIKELGLTFRGILSLFWPWASVKPFVDDDYDQEPKINPAISRKPKAEIDKLRLEYEPVVRERLGTFRWGVWGSFF